MKKKNLSDKEKKELLRDTNYLSTEDVYNLLPIGQKAARKIVTDIYDDMEQKKMYRPTSHKKLISPQLFKEYVGWV